MNTESVLARPEVNAVLQDHQAALSIRDMVVFRRAVKVVLDGAEIESEPSTRVAAENLMAASVIQGVFAGVTATKGEYHV